MKTQSNLLSNSYFSKQTQNTSKYGLDLLTEKFLDGNITI